MEPNAPPADGSGAVRTGKRGLVVGIANQKSIAYGCARALREAGAELAITYLDAKAEPYVRPLAEALDAAIIMPLDVQIDGQPEAVFAAIRQSWGQLDFVIHSIAFCSRDDLHGRAIDCSAVGFQQAMHVSCYSFLHMARLAEPLMPAGGSLVAMSYYGAEKVVPNYNIMGPVKAALEACVRYSAIELAGARIRVNALSPRPLRTRAASGLAHFDELMETVDSRLPPAASIDIDDVGKACAFLVSDAARGISGSVIHVDGGFHVTA